MTRASGMLRRLLADVDEERHDKAERQPRGAKAVIDHRAATRLSAVVSDGKLPEHAVAAEGEMALGNALAAALPARIAPVTVLAASALACLWAGSRANQHFGNPVAHTATGGGFFGAPTAAAAPMFGAGRDPGETGGDPAMNPKNSARMAAMAMTAAVTANGALAGDAVQWRVADGGNGHWYRLVLADGAFGWLAAKRQAESMGGHLGTIGSNAENQFVAIVASDASAWRGVGDFYGPWLGGFQDQSSPGYREPDGGWRWVTGEPWEFTSWSAGLPNNAGAQDYLHLYSGTVGQVGALWDDVEENFIYPPIGGPLVVSSIVEWDADCNSDGIVDYGQCHDGTLPDYNTNNVPDCCERSEACVIGHYPAQWRATDGGNGHWYRDDHQFAAVSFGERNRYATAIGAHLATVTSQPEHEFVLKVAFPSGLLGSDDAWPALGGHKAANSEQWVWVTQEPFVYAPFSPDPPHPELEQYLMMWGHQLYVPLLWWTGNGTPTITRAIIEWSADCNSDGIVDYGQILTGALADANSNGIPDSCECATNPSLPSCCPGDIYRNGRVDGADLGALLSEWGPVTPLTNSDLDGNGQVNGADLGILLAHWGPCGG